MTAIRHDPRVRRPGRARLQQIADIAIPLAVGVVLLAVVLDPAVEGGPAQLVGVVLAIAQGIALRWRRSHPERVMVFSLAGGLAIQLIAPSGVIPYAGVFALASLASLRPPRVSLPALAALLALAATNVFTAKDEDTLFALVIVVVPWAFGEMIRNRSVAISEAARRAASDEQARIARELHDVIAHSVSVIVVQAAAADDVFDARPDQARAALRSIESTGRDALRELRQLLTAVRPDAGAGGTQTRPGLDRLEELAEPLRSAGLNVSVHRQGAGSALPTAVDLSVYRIVQEALTNTLRHAGASHVDVTVRRSPDGLELDVVDDGRGSAGAADGQGKGIAGMRERAAMLGGTLEAGPLAGGGYRVRARVPIEAAS